MSDVTELYELRVVVERIEGRSVCGLEVQAVLPLLPAKPYVAAIGNLDPTRVIARRLKS
jgi:hypothetical protein